MDDEKWVIAQIEAAKILNIDGFEFQDEVHEIKDSTLGLSHEQKIKFLIKAVQLIDLTSLKGNETYDDIMKLCKSAEMKTLEEGNTFFTAAVCVFPANARDAIKCLKELNLRDKIRVASVAGDFPCSKLPLQERIDEIKLVVDYGVDEVDIVINRQLAIEDRWKELYDELKLVREACGDKKMKTILATGDLPNIKHIYMASLIAMLAGTDFIKTSTGKEAVNATILSGLVMCTAIKDFHDLTGKKVGLKPAGGISSAEDVLHWMAMVADNLGIEWCNRSLFRIGASSALNNIIQEIIKLKSEL